MASTIFEKSRNKTNGRLGASTRNLDFMDYTRMARGLTIHNPSLEEVAALLASARQQIDGLASEAKVLEVYNHNPDSLFVVTRRRSNGDVFKGVLAQLPLNEAGHRGLFDGSLDTADPDITMVARQNEIPSAIYSWCMVVDNKTAGAISLLIERFSSPKNAQAPIYCRPASDKARQFFVTVGFSGPASWEGRQHDELMEYVRQNEASIPQPFEPYNRHPQADDDYGVTVVHDFEEFQQMLAVRAATYMAEHDCPYEEEFDGNDFSCTHMLGQIGKEPAGCIRIRYFASFAKIERLAVLPKFRRTPIANRLIDAAIALCRKKGYREIYGHCEPRVRKLWMRRGFVPRTEKPTFGFSQRAYIEGDMILDPANDVLTKDSGPLVLNRPEGRWSEPGILERKPV